MIGVMQPQSREVGVNFPTIEPELTGQFEVV